MSEWTELFNGDTNEILHHDYQFYVTQLTIIHLNFDIHFPLFERQIAISPDLRNKNSNFFRDELEALHKMYCSVLKLVN